MAWNNYNSQGDSGKVSEWNEGNWKNLRLHEAQEIINTSKIDPLRNVSGVWDFQKWISGIDILFGEGSSKYSKEEIETVRHIRALVERFILTAHPFKTIIVQGLSRSQQKHELNYKNWEQLKKVIEFYEEKVKHYNDTHGLSTRNYDYDDEGL